jgi:hypothetical protein
LSAANNLCSVTEVHEVSDKPNRRVKSGAEKQEILEGRESGAMRLRRLEQLGGEATFRRGQNSLTLAENSRVIFITYESDYTHSITDELLL